MSTVSSAEILDRLRVERTVVGGLLQDSPAVWQLQRIAFHLDSAISVAQNLAQLNDDDPEIAAATHIAEDLATQRNLHMSRTVRLYDPRNGAYLGQSLYGPHNYYGYGPSVISIRVPGVTDPPITVLEVERLLFAHRRDHESAS